MRTMQVEEITKEVEQMCKEAAYYLPQDIYEALKKGRETEESPVGQVVLDQIIKNSEIARAEDRPICQDTGMTIIFLEVGQDVHFEGGDLTEAINKGVANGYVNGYLRKSVVAEPLFDRKNTQNNTPAIIYTKIVPGDQLKIELTCKGFGSENKGGIKMLVPADGVEGVKKNAQVHVEDQTVEGYEELKHPKYEVYTDKAGEFRFRLKASNGEIIATGEGYKAKASCMNGIESIGKNAPEAEVIVIEA